MVKIEDHSDEFQRALAEGLKMGSKLTAHRIVELAQQLAPIAEHHGGTLKQSIDVPEPPKTKRQKGRTSYEVEFGAYVEYALSVEFGSAGRGEPMGSSYNQQYGDIEWPIVPPGKKTWGPYPIKPIPPNTALRWKGPDGQWIYASQVLHPGNFHQPFLRPAVDYVVAKDMKKIVRQAIQKSMAQHGLNS